MHHSYRITMHAQNGARALTRGQNLAGIWVAWHEDAELLAAEEPHQCPGIRQQPRPASRVLRKTVSLRLRAKINSFSLKLCTI